MKNKEPKNLIEVASYFSDELVCRKHLEQIRWKGNVACPFCGSVKVYRFSDAKRYKCGEKECRKIFTVTVGTFFENSKIPLSKWFVAIYLITSHKKGISSCQLSRDISVKQQTAWFMLHRIRHMMHDKSGYEFNGISEVDEVYLGGSVANMHRHKRKKLKEEGKDNKTPVIAMVQRGNRRVHMQMLNEVNAPELKKFVRANLKEGSKLMTDGHPGYFDLKNDYEHQTVSHAIGEYVRGEAHTNTVEGFFSHLQRSIFGIYHQVSVKHLMSYCNEAGFRYETCKQGEMERINTSIGNCEGRLKYADLIIEK